MKNEIRAVARIGSDELKRALSFSRKALGGRVSIPILAFSKLSWSGDKLSIRTTNLEIYVESRVQYEEIEGEGEALFKVSDMLGVISGIDGEIAIELFVDDKGSWIEVSALPKMRATLPSASVDDFPNWIEDVSGWCLTLDAKLARGMKDLVEIASTKNVKPGLEYVIFEPKTGTGVRAKVAATDGYRIAIMESEFLQRSWFDPSPSPPAVNDRKPAVLIPSRVAELMAAWPSPHDLLFVTGDGLFIDVTSRDYSVRCAVSSNSFPMYERAVPQAGISFRVRSSDLIRRLQAAKKSRVESVFLDFGPEDIVLLYGPEDRDPSFVIEHDEPRFIGLTSEEAGKTWFCDAYSPRFLLDAVGLLPGEWVEFMICGRNRPLKISSVIGASEYVTVTMPKGSERKGRFYHYRTERT